MALVPAALRQVAIQRSNMSLVRPSTPSGTSTYMLPKSSLSRASFRRQPVSGKKTFTALSSHINNVYVKKRGKGKKLILTIRDAWTWLLVHGDATTATTLASLKRPLLTALCRCLSAPHHCGDPGSIPGNWTDVCGFLKPPESDRQWKVRLHGAFAIPRDVLGLRPNDQSCHHEAWLHLDLVDRGNEQPHHETSEIMSDHSLSSWYRDDSRTPMRRPTSRVLRASSSSDLMKLPTDSNK